MGSSSKKGTSGSATQSSPYQQAPRLGVSQADTDAFNASTSAYNTQQDRFNRMRRNGGGKGSNYSDMTDEQLWEVRDQGYDVGNDGILSAPESPQGLSSQDLINQTTMGVNNAYGSSTPVQNEDGTWTMTNQMNAGNQAFYDSAFKPIQDNQEDYSNALFSNALAKLNPAMANRGLPAGSEINDTSMMNASMQSILGGNQMYNQDQQMANQNRGIAMGLADRVGGGQMGDVMGSVGMEYGANQAPWMQEINRQNMQFQADNNMNMQNQANAASNKQSKNQAMGSMGSSYLGK